MSAGVFSESWYRVADQRVSLRAHVQVRRQFFRGEKWYVLEDPFNNQFFRIRPESHAFLMRLGRGSTVEQVWKECLERDPANAPGQEDVIRLLAQLHHANLLQYGLPEDSLKLFERFKRRRNREIRSKVLGFMFMRIPLWDPDDFLRRTQFLVRPLLGRMGVLLWLGLVLFALKVGIDHAPALLSGSQGILAPANLPLLYTAMVIIKGLHEMGHAYACRHFGGEVHTMGVMLLIFTPVPYVDATSSWAFRSKWQRAAVGAAGMIVELFVAAIALVVWANTGEGLLHSLCYNIIFIASVSTLVFNLNPLMRFDGYYILSDLLEIPSLHSRSFQQWRHLLEHRVFGVKNSTGPARRRGEAAWLLAFGLLSSVYKMFVFASIALFMADRYLILGVVMAISTVLAVVVGPLLRFVHYLASSPRLQRTRPRAWAATAAFAGVWIVALCWVPVPHAIRAPGIVQAREFQWVAGQAAGRLKSLAAPSGAPVRAGQELLVLEDPELELAIRAAAAEVSEADARVHKTLAVGGADLAPLRAYREAVIQRLARLKESKHHLVIRAPFDGTWICPEGDQSLGRWIPQGQPLGMMVGVSGFRFVSVIPQSEAARLFGEIRLGGIRLRGQGGLDLPASSILVVPAQQDTLPSAALGWNSGGEIAVSTQDGSGTRTQEPYFQVIAEIGSTPEVGLFHGASGVIRFPLKAEPLLPRWINNLRKLLQKRYQV